MTFDLFILSGWARFCILQAHFNSAKRSRVSKRQAMEGEEFRTGSADSENGSEGSYVQVSPEDVQISSDPTEQHVDPDPSTAPPIVDDSEDIYGEPDQDDTLSSKEPVS